MPNKVFPVGELANIYEKYGLRVDNNTPELKSAFRMKLKIELVKFAYNSSIKTINSLEEKFIPQSREIPIIPLMYVYESFFYQIRSAMDYWAKFLSLLPIFKSYGQDFEKHKKNVLNKYSGKRYKKYVENMGWYVTMRRIRNEIKTGSIRVFTYDSGLNGFTINVIDKQSANGRKKLIKDQLNDFFIGFVEYSKFVINHFS